MSGNSRLDKKYDDDEPIDLLRIVKKNKAPLSLELKKVQILNTKSEVPILASAFEQQDTDIKVVASLVPDEIIYNVDDYSKRVFDGCLLAGDVSGFTELTETYSKVEGGPSKVTQILNRYIGAMVQESMSYGGDILKFSGDAFIIMYKKTDFLSLRDAVHEAIDCALIIQKTHGVYTTDVGVVIRVKLVISAGTLTFSIIGDDNNAHYLEIGSPIWDIKSMEYKSNPGDIIVCQSAWKYINNNDYFYTKLGEHVKVQGIGQNWRPIMRNVGQKAHSRMSGPEDTSEDIYLLRPAVNYAATRNLKEQLRKFIIAPVMRAIDLNQPLDYLTEVRHVTVVFINVVISKNVLSINEYLDVSNETYKVVCAILNKYSGIMNKMNVFDKDLMMLTIFGFRGNLLGGEAERGLKCASECYESIKDIKHVNSVSCGITSGNTYCGVFGHTLRKEYTVMGKIVNKAARLMIAYPDKLVCDRVTFLLCKMSIKHFTLMPYKPLKGIAHPGPLYQYKNIQVYESLPTNILQFPLLGRENEIKTYVNLLQIAENHFRATETPEEIISILVIQGKPLLGKRRLSEEFICLTPDHIPINRILLSSDNEDKYEPLRQLFYPPMGLPIDSSRIEREAIIQTRLNKPEYGDILWCLNPIFQVSFPIDKSVKYTDVQIVVLIRKLLTQLAYKTFVTFWLILIRKLDNIEEDVWHYFLVISKLNLMFFACEETDNSRRVPSPNEKNIQVINLEPIHRVYHAALACQCLGVRGISPELDRFIQSKSKGTPGYLENVLMTMRQNNEVLMSWTSRKEAYDGGFVLPPEYMLKRHLKNDMRSYSEMRWDMYNECYKDDDRFSPFIQAEQEKGIQVAILNPDMEMLDETDIINEYNYAINNKMMRVYDACTPFEQLIIKGSSVLLQHFQRIKLLYVMNAKADEQTSLAIKSLFERKVLTCAHGDFLDGDELTFTGRQSAPNETNDIKCDCKGIILEDFGLNLPKYASCGYLQFRFTEFREMCYGLLTENQKKEFHHRAIRFLELETRKCRPCGAGYFAIIVSRHSRDIINRGRSTIIPKKTKPSFSINANNVIWNRMIEEGVIGTNTTLSSSTLDVFRRKSPVMSSDPFQLNMNVKSETIQLRESGTRFFFDSRFKRDLEPVSSFSDFDFGECRCLLILLSMHCEIIHHAKGIDNPDQLYHAKISYVYRCVESDNHIEAKNVLNQALVLLNEPWFKDNYLDWQIDLKRGKIYTLIGIAELSSNHLEEAYGDLTTALNLYGFPFPTSTISINHRLRMEKLKLAFRFFCSPHHRFTTNEGEHEFCTNLSECLYHMCSIFLMNNMWRKAELAAYWALNKALDSGENLIIHLKAYANILKVLYCIQSTSFIPALEIKALQLTKIIRNFDKRELTAIVELMSSVFLRRRAQLLFDKLWELGTTIWNVAKNTNAVSIILQTLPSLISIRIVSKQITEAIPILNDLYCYANYDVDKSGLFAYFSLCLIMQLETGFSIEPMRRCENFIIGEAFKSPIRDSNSRPIFIILMWLWYVRKCQWESAKQWEEEAFSFVLSRKISFIDSAIAALYLLEGLIIYMVYKMDKRNFSVVRVLQNKIANLIKQIRKHKHYIKTIKIRLASLEIYYQLVLQNNYKLLDKFNKLQKKAVKNNNALEIDRLKHIQLAWANRLPLNEINRWTEKCDIDTYFEYTSIEEGKIITYTPPLPLYL